MLQSAQGHDGATLHVELLAALCIGIDGHLSTTGTHGKNKSSLDVAVAVGIDTVVRTGLCIHISTADGQVAGSVQRIVVGIAGHFAARHIHRTLRLDTLTVATTGAHPDATAADVQVAIYLDALGRCRVVVRRILRTLRDDIRAATVEVGLLVYVDTLAARTRALQPQLTAVHRKHRVSLQAGSTLGLQVFRVPYSAAGGNHRRATAVHHDVSLAVEALCGSCRHLNVQDTAIDEDTVVGLHTVIGRRLGIYVVARIEHDIVG